MCSLEISLFSHDYITMEMDLLKYQQCLNLFTCVQHIYSAWFLDGSTSMLVTLETIEMYCSADSF